MKRKSKCHLICIYYESANIISLLRLNVTEDGKKALITLSKGDMRKVLNVLQSTSMAFATVDEDSVYTCVGHPLRRDIEKILETLLATKGFAQAYDGKKRKII